ncbi:MAG: antitoxin Xre/MbcA/ParS toxin-binding domain-containing protein [Burkholderiaceae bacterium]
MRATPTSKTSQSSQTLSKAVIKAAELLELKQVSLAKILGLSTATASRLHAGTYLLSPERGKEWELALIFVRVFRSLDAVLGHGDSAKKWLAGNNLALNGRPTELMETTEGLIRVLHYLDAHRGRI